MKLSRFVLTYRNVRPGEHVLYDVIQDHYVGIDDATLQAVGRWEGAAPDSGEETQVQQLLRSEGFLVDSRQEDDARVREFLDKAAEGMPGTMYITLMPTLVCNLACHYCFQKEHPEFTQMKDPTEASTIEWILRRVDAAGCQKLVVHYFGGEPLTRKDLLLRSAEVFSASMAARGGSFEWEITTNGVGMDVEFVRRLRQFGPGTIKVTLDGDKETHDKARVYRNGKGSFDVIFKNTIAVLKSGVDVRLRIGGNYRPEDVASYEKLLDRLEAAGVAGLLDRVHFKPIVDSARKEPGACDTCGSADDETDTFLRLSESIQRRGLAREKPHLPAGPCELHWKNSYVIDPEGRVYKCPAVAGRPELAVASTKMMFAQEKKAPLLELRPWEKCGDCPFLPVCVGGCLGAKFLQTGRRDEVFCRRSDFERTFAADVKARYLSEFGGISDAA